jgi:hypothetical protein
MWARIKLRLNILSEAFKLICLYLLFYLWCVLMATTMPDPIIHPLTHVLARLSRSEQLQVMQTHPLFTGKCPCCGTSISTTVQSTHQLNCHSCGWVDDVTAAAA